MAILQATITEAGIAAVIAAANNGRNINLAQIALGAGEEQSDGMFTGYTPVTTQQALKAERSRNSINEGRVIAADHLHLSAVISGTISYEIKEIGVYLDTTEDPGFPESVLFAIYAVATNAPPLFQKNPNIDVLISFDLLLDSDVPEDTISLSGATQFALPAASNQEHGVIKIATAENVRNALYSDSLTPQALAELNARAVTPSSLTLSHLDSPNGLHLSSIDVDIAGNTNIANHLTINGNLSVAGDLNSVSGTLTSANLSVSHAGTFAEMHISGNVELPTSAIRINEGDLYLDGQHRLALGWAGLLPEKLQGPNSPFDRSFGASVAISENIMVVGTPNFSNAYLSIGIAYVFEQKNGNWVYREALGPSNLRPFVYFGRSVAISGNTIVAASFANVSTPVVEIFRLINGVWERQDPLQVEGETFFGHSIAISGNTVAVSAPGGGTDEDEVNENSVYIFQLEENGWTQKEKLQVQGELGFGASIAIDDDILVIGAPSVGSAGENSGSVYVFQLEAGNWSQKSRLRVYNEAPEDNFGAHVALSNNVVVIGAPGQSTGGQNAGRAYVFQLENGQWLQTAILEADDQEADDRFGEKLAIGGPVIAVGVPNKNSDAVNTGSVYIFQQESGNWTQTAKLNPGDQETDDRFGSAVAVGDNLVAIGAPNEDTAGTDAGSVFVYNAELALIPG